MDRRTRFRFKTKSLNSVSSWAAITWEGLLIGVINALIQRACFANERTRKMAGEVVPKQVAGAMNAKGGAPG